MKRYITQIVIAIFIVLTTACESYLMNGDLDGLWQVRSVERFSADTITTNDGELFMSFQQYTVLLSYNYPDKLTGSLMANYLSLFEHTGDYITMGYFRDFNLHNSHNKVPLDRLERFGIFQDTTTFYIESLNHKSLILTSDSARIVFRKY